MDIPANKSAGGRCRVRWIAAAVARDDTLSGNACIIEMSFPGDPYFQVNIYWFALENILINFYSPYEKIVSTPIFYFDAARMMAAAFR